MRYLLFACVIAILSGGCVSSKVDSRKDPAFNQKITKIYLILNTPKYATEFREKFKETFLSELAKKNILCYYEVPDPLALETPEDQQKRIAEANTDVIIRFTQTESKTSTSYHSFNGPSSQSYTASGFDVRMFLPTSNRPIWRASIDLAIIGDFSGGAKTAKKLIEQMAKDGLI